MARRRDPPIAAPLETVLGFRLPGCKSSCDTCAALQRTSFVIPSSFMLNSSAAVLMSSMPPLSSPTASAIRVAHSEIR